MTWFVQLSLTDGTSNTVLCFPDLTLYLQQIEFHCQIFIAAFSGREDKVNGGRGPSR